MPATRRSGLAIHYELDGSGLPLVLLHGGFSSSAVWRIDGYVDGLRDDHQLVLIDIRGHGQSDKPHEPEAYWSSVLASDVVAVLDELGLASATLCGFSLGANIALRVAVCHPRRADAIAAIGSGPGQVGFVIVPGADHVGVMERPDVILPELRTFLASAALIKPTTPPGR